jgi:hypothetical protein
MLVHGRPFTEVLVSGPPDDLSRDPAASRAAPALIGAAGEGLIGSAVFTTARSVATRRERPMRSPTDPYRHRPQSGGSPGVRRPARRRTRQWLAVLAGRPAPLRPLQRRHHCDHAHDHGPGRCGLRPIAPAQQPRRAVPARQHHHRLCLAHSPVRTSAPAKAHDRSTTPPGRLSVSPDHPKCGIRSTSDVARVGAVPVIRRTSLGRSSLP